MGQQSWNWVDYGNLAIGIGTFTLAIVLAFVNWKTSHRDRQVHIADKRQEWCISFRHLVSEMLAIQNKILKPIGLSEAEIQKEIQELGVIQYKIELLFPELDGDYMRLSEPIRVGFLNLNQAKPEPSLIALERMEILKIAKEILENQRKKIAELNTESPLI